MREAPSLVLIDLLLKAGCNVAVYDPVAMTECKRRLGAAVRYATDIYDATTGADAIMHVTEWKSYRMPDWKRIASVM